MSGVSGKQSLQTIKLMHLALMAGLILFSVVVIFLITSGSPRTEVIDTTILMAVAGGLTFAAIFLGPILYKQQLTKLERAKTLSEKMNIFQSAHIIRSALVEGAGLVGAVTCIIGGNLYGLALTAICIGLFILKFPNPEMIGEDLKLSSGEKKELFS